MWVLKVNYYKSEYPAKKYTDSLIIKRRSVVIR